MKIYIGHPIPKGQQDKAGTTLYSKGEVHLLSQTPPNIHIELPQGQTLWLWGRIYGCHTASGEVVAFKGSTHDLEILKTVVKGRKPLDFVKDLEGYFAGVMSQGDGEWFVFADQYNRRDIYYAHDGQRLAAGLSIPDVIAAVGVNGYVQEALMNIFYVYGSYAPKKHTMYKGICRLGVGESLHVTGKKVSVEAKPFKPVSTQAYSDDQLHEYARLVRSSIEIRASHGTNWVSLSSGWDSSSLVAMLTHLYGPSRIRAVTNRCLYSKDSGVMNQFEIDRAKKIADYFHVPLDIVEIDFTKPDYLQYWGSIREALRANHLYTMGNYDYMKLAQYVSSQAKPGDSFFNGEISDGAHNIGFAQQATLLDHPDLSFREYGDKMMAYLFGPSFMKRVLKGDADKDIVYQFFKKRMEDCAFDDPNAMDKETRLLRFAESFFFSASRMPFISLKNSLLFTPQGQGAYQTHMVEGYLRPFAKEATPETVYAWYLHLYNSFHWQGSTVKGVSHASDHYGIDMSMPFWDSRIQHFLSAMPEHWGRGLDLNQTKYPLKWMLKNKVDYPHHLQVGPHSYLYDINPNWNGDADILYNQTAKGYYKDQMKNYPYEKVLEGSHFNLGYLKKLTDDYMADKPASGQERNDLKNLVNLCAVGWFS